MAINIDEVYKFVQFVANKEQSGFIKPSEFNLAVDRAQMQFFMERYNNPAEYQPGNPVPRVAYNQTQKVSDDLRQFIKRVTLPVNSDGLMNYPNDYLHFSSASSNFVDVEFDRGTTADDCPGCNKTTVRGSVTSNVTTKTVSIRPVDDSELAGLLSSSIVNPTLEFPVLTFYQEGIQYHPKNINTVDFVYLRKPVKPQWDYTVSGNRPVYNPAGSIDLEWPIQVFNEIAIRILSFVGINLREGDLSQYSESKRQTGI
jgi:hypothetical protein|tara:strand:+ start:1225 stop:1995 length:771 start_codon:yes stop_codon:yes gene_type:complete